MRSSSLQLRDSIDQDNQKAAHLRSQINEYEGKIRESQKKREMVESCLDQIRGLQNQIQIKEGKRETLMKLKAQQFKDLEEENEGKQTICWVIDRIESKRNVKFGMIVYPDGYCYQRQWSSLEETSMFKRSFATLVLYLSLTCTIYVNSCIQIRTKNSQLGRLSFKKKLVSLI